MIKKGNRQQCIVLTPNDQLKLDYLCEKYGLKPTQIYRLALNNYYRLERSEKD